MRIRTSLYILFMCIGLYTKAQNYVTIPDTNFALWLSTQYPACMNGNQMDTTCPDIISETHLSFINTNFYLDLDLTGIKYFKNLQYLHCEHNLSTGLPELPKTIKTLYCGDNQLVSLPTLPDSLLYLDCSENVLTSLPALPNSLCTLICDYNELLTLPNLPASMVHLECSRNNLTGFPALPDSLTYLKCDHNDLISLPVLPANLMYLNCHSNELTGLPTLPHLLNRLDCALNDITSLPALPNSLQKIYCSFNELTSLPALPNLLTDFMCDNNQLTGLPALPNSLIYLYCNDNQIINLPTLSNNLLKLECSDNQLTNLPTLPPSLYDLYCDQNQLLSLPALTGSLIEIRCRNNQLICLPALPNSLYSLYCSYNYLNSLPTLPINLHNLNCTNNQISCFPVFPNSLSNMVISSNPFTCLPNYNNSMTNVLLTYPLCEQGDTLFNPYGCAETDGIRGFTFQDNNSNCTRDAGDNGLINIPVKLYDNNNNLVEQMSTHGIGGYLFVKQAGTYTVAIDTSAMPFLVQCANPGIDTTVTITQANPIANQINFSFACKPGLDVGAQSAVTTGWVFPGQQLMLSVVAGEMSQWYNLNCGTGVDGQVIINVNGPVTYMGPAPGALTPLVSGNTFTYNISDYDSINNSEDFGLLFSTNTSAQFLDSICVGVTVTPIAGDINPGNNTFHSCFLVLNSFDPNMKEVYPVDILPGYDGYFTYTIHFQNTGTAPAFNIRLLDTLSNNLDLETFQVINYSHSNTTSLIGNILTFRFPNIMLPDSTTDEPGSKGFIQYKVKPKANLSAGTQIKNTAHIYFDYNAPIATNTTINEFVINVSSNVKNPMGNLIIYPNPTPNFLTIENPGAIKENFTLSLTNIQGQMLFTEQVEINKTHTIDLSKFSDGIYFLTLQNAKENYVGKVVVQR